MRIGDNPDRAIENPAIASRPGARNVGSAPPSRRLWMVWHGLLGRPNASVRGRIKPAVADYLINRCLRMCIPYLIYQPLEFASHVRGVSLEAVMGGTQNERHLVTLTAIEFDEVVRAKDEAYSHRVSGIVVLNF